MLDESRCPILGYALKSMKIDGNEVPKGLLQVNEQSRVGNEGYDAGAKILTDFFKEQLVQFDTSDIDPLGHKIIQACLDDASVQDYYDLIPKL